ncbi:MAG: hypothetical protein AAFR58_09950 [Cyanobacteria bacterium J06627_28]
MTESLQENIAESVAENVGQSKARFMARLRAQYLQLINTDLPQKAKQTHMPVRFNHCFARIVLDNLFKDCWYRHLSKKEAAYKQLNEQQLQQAIELARSMLDDSQKSYQLNQNSLKWRGKLR